MKGVPSSPTLAAGLTVWLCTMNEEHRGLCLVYAPLVPEQLPQEEGKPGGFGTRKLPWTEKNTGADIQEAWKEHANEGNMDKQESNGENVLRRNMEVEGDADLTMSVVEHEDGFILVLNIPEKDSSIKFFIDFWYLNSVSQFNPYLTPRINNLLECLRKEKFLTMTDLCKGYWEAPMS